MMKAMMMLCLQRGLIQFCHASAQTAKAAGEMSSDVKIACTNHALFGLTCRPNGDSSVTCKKVDSQDFISKSLSASLIFFIDECSLIPADMFAMMHQQMGYASSSTSFNGLFGGRCVILFGDQCQLTLGRPLYKSNPSESDSYEKLVEEENERIAEKQNGANGGMASQLQGGRMNNSIQGRLLWLQFEVHQLTEVNRFLDSRGGKILARIVQNLRVGILTDKDADVLNSRYIGEEKNEIAMSDTLWQQALMINPRNAMLTEAATMLQMASGLAQNKTVYVWRTAEFYKGTSNLLGSQDYVAAGKVNFRKANSFRTEIYFEGIEYSFCENKCTSLGWTKQAGCIGVDLKLSPDETSVVGNRSKVIYLSRQPRGIVVKPLAATKVAREKDFGHGKGHLLIKRDTSTFVVPRVNGSEFSVTRIGFVNLWPSQVKTDYNVQCTTQLYPKKLLVDLVKPATGNLGSESMLVTLSRGQDICQIGLVRPMYKNKLEKKFYLQSIRKTIQLNKEKAAELQRMRQESDKLELHNEKVMKIAKEIGCARRKNTYKFDVK